MTKKLPKTALFCTLFALFQCLAASCVFAQSPFNVQWDERSTSDKTKQTNDEAARGDPTPSNVGHGRSMEIPHESIPSPVVLAAIQSNPVGEYDDAMKEIAPKVLKQAIQNPTYPQETPHDLQIIEAAAKENFENKNYLNAFNLYQHYEKRMQEAGFDLRQTDLLQNQILVAFKAQKFDHAIAYLHQLDILEPDPQNVDKFEAIRNLVEHRIYQEYPNTVFIRGQTNDYQTWKRIHQYSRPLFFAICLALWGCLFVLSAIIYAHYTLQKRSSRKLVYALLPLWALAAYFLLSLVVEREYTREMQFAVLLDNTSLRANVSPNPQQITDPSFAEGLTVRILSQNEDWSFIQRADGMTAWISNSDIYKLRTLDQATMNLPIKAYRESQQNDASKFNE